MSKFDSTTSYEYIQSKLNECRGDDGEINDDLLVPASWIKETTTKNYEVIRRDERLKKALEL